MRRKWYVFVLCLTAVVLALPVTPAQAGFVGGPSPAVVTAAEAKSLPDDAWVTLQGYIERHIREDHYLFRDETGTITVEIDDEEWGGLVVKPTDKIEISGEVDREFTSLKIDVDRLRLLDR